MGKMEKWRMEDTCGGGNVCVSGWKKPEEQIENSVEDEILKF